MSSAIVPFVNKEYNDQNIIKLIQNSDLWIDFSDESTITTSNGDRKTVTGVTDKSINPKTMSVNGAGYYEDSTKSYFNNYLAAVYIFTTGYVGPTIASPNETIFVVTSQAPSNSSLVATPTAGCRWVNVQNFQVRVGAYSSFSVSGAITLAAGVQNLISVVIANGAVNIFVNGRTDTSGTINITGTPTVTRIAGADASWFNRGNIHETILFQSALPDSQRQAIEYYLMNKWKIPTSTIPSPLSVSGCTLWLDGNDESSVTYSSGTNISQWNDKSTNNYHATQVNAGNQPLYDSALKGVTFNGTTSFLRTTSPFNRINETLFIIYRWPGTGGSFLTIFSSPTTTNGGRQVVTTGGTNKNISLYNGSAAALSGSIAQIANTPIIVEFRFSINAGNTFAYLNGNSATIAQVNPSGISFSTQANLVNALGSASTNTPTNVFNGTVHEVVLFNKILTGSERRSIREYLINKWNVNIPTPLNSLHPYVSVPPFLRYFQPIDVSGCSLWLDASDNTTLTLNVSNVITQWRDKSGNAYHGTGVGNLTLQSVANNNNGILFDNQNSHFYHVSSFAMNTTNTLTAFCVAALATSTPFISTDLRILSLGNPDNTSGFNCVPFQRYLTNDSISNNRNSDLLVPTLTITPGTTFQSTSVFATTKTDNYINGNLNVSKTHTTKGSFNYSQYTVGISDNGTNTWGGTISEIIVYNRNLNNVERQMVEGYLAWKWKLSSFMPSTHPFYNDVPLFPRFDIRKIPSIFWLDGTDPNGDGTLPSVGSSVTTWVDKSGNGNNVTQSNASLAPTFNYDGTYPGLLFDGSTEYMTAPSGKLTATTFTVIVIFRRQTDVPANRILFNLVKTIGTTVRYFSIFSNDGSAQSRYLIYSVRNNASNIFKSAVSPGNTNRTIISSTENALVSDATFAWVNGSPLTTVNAPSGTYAVGDPYGFVLGANRGTLATPSYSNFHNGYIHEVFAFTPLNVVERQQVEGYLAWKWGLQSSLPTSHPYYKHPPY